MRRPPPFLALRGVSVRRSAGPGAGSPPSAPRSPAPRPRSGPGWASRQAGTPLAAAAGGAGRPPGGARRSGPRRAHGPGPSAAAGGAALPGGSGPGWGGGGRGRAPRLLFPASAESLPSLTPLRWRRAGSRRGAGAEAGGKVPGAGPGFARARVGNESGRVGPRADPPPFRGGWGGGGGRQRHVCPARRREAESPRVPPGCAPGRVRLRAVRWQPRAVPAQLLGARRAPGRLLRALSLGSHSNFRAAVRTGSRRAAAAEILPAVAEFLKNVG